MEQGTHKELVEMNGNFAAMWADQISSADDPASSIAKKSSHRSINTVSQKNEGAEQVAEDVARPESVAADAPQAYNVDPSVAPSVRSAAPSVPATQNEEKTSTAPAVAFPTSAPSVDDLGSSAAASAPISFPTASDDRASSIRAQAATPTPGGVTFDQNTAKSGSPEVTDPESKKRRGTQNFQRIARRISLGSKRPDSLSSGGGFAAMIPGLRRDKEPSSSTPSPRMSEDNLTRAPTVDSPTPSVTGSDSKVKEKKDKKGRKSFLSSKD